MYLFNFIMGQILLYYCEMAKKMIALSSKSKKVKLHVINHKGNFKSRSNSRNALLRFLYK